MKNKEAQRLYWCLARGAIKAGLMDKYEARAIARVGHRKEHYWVRHYEDLIAVLTEKQERKQT